MPTYKTSFNGKTLRLTADTPEQAATAARLYFAGRGRADEVAQEANQRGQAAIRDKGLDDPMSPEFQALREQGEMRGTAEAGPYAAGIVGLGGAAGMAPAGLLPGLAKDTAIYGAAELGEKVLGLPSWTSEVVGAISPGKQLLKYGLGKLGVGGAVKAAQTGAAQTAEAAAAKVAEREAAKMAAQRVAEKKLELEARKVAAREAESAARIKALEETTKARIAAMERRVAGGVKPKAVPQAAPKPDPDIIPDEAVSLVAEPLPFTPRAARPPKPKFIDESAVSVAPSAPFDQRAIPRDVAQIAQQIQQKSGMLRPDGAGMRGGKAMVEEELEKLPAGIRSQVEGILARGQGHPATAASGATRSVGTAVARESKPLANPVMEFARNAVKTGEAGPVNGSKIWIELDAAGNPVGLLKDGYARPAAGNTKTWVANLWGSKTASNVF